MRFGWKLVVWVFAALGALATVLTLYPRFSVDAQSLQDPSDPFSMSYTIVNDGYLPLYDLGYAIHVKKLFDANGKTFKHPKEQSYIPDFLIMANAYPKWKLLWPDDKATIIPIPFHSPDFQFATPLREGELEVIVSYKYGLRIFGRQQRRFSFTATTSSGQQTWVREPRAD